MTRWLVNLRIGEIEDVEAVNVKIVDGALLFSDPSGPNYVIAPDHWLSAERRDE